MTSPANNPSLAALAEIEKQHRDRARTLSELANKLIAKRRLGLPKTFDEWLQDADVLKRAAEHLGASQAVNEMRLALEGGPPPAAPTTPS